MKTSLALSLAAFLGVSLASASDNVRFDVYGSFAPGTGSSTVTLENAPFDFSFLVPEAVSKDFSVAWDGSLHLSESILAGEYTLNGVTTSGTGGFFAFSPNGPGTETFLRLDLPNETVYAESNPSTGGTFPVLLNAPGADGWSHFKTGDLGAANLSVAEWDTDTGSFFVSNLAVQVAGRIEAAPVPEPGTVAYVGIGSLALAGWTLRGARCLKR